MSDIAVTAGGACDAPETGKNPNPQGKGVVPMLRDWQSVQPAFCGSKTAAEIKARTATVLQGRFCTLCSVDEALARAQAAA